MCTTQKTPIHLPPQCFCFGRLIPIWDNSEKRFIDMREKIALVCILISSSCSSSGLLSTYSSSLSGDGLFVVHVVVYCRTASSFIFITYKTVWHRLATCMRLPFHKTPPRDLRSAPLDSRRLLSTTGLLNEGDLDHTKLRVETRRQAGGGWKIRCYLLTSVFVAVQVDNQFLTLLLRDGCICYVILMHFITAILSRLMI